MRRLRDKWRGMAQTFANRCAPSNPKYRFFISMDEASVVVAETALMAARGELNSAYRRAVKHKRSKKAVDLVRDKAREVGSLGLYLLERSGL